MLTMKTATIEDLDYVYLLSNDQVIRDISLHSEPISYENHVKWFKGVISNPDVLFFLFYDGVSLKAQVRFLRVSPDMAEISISLSNDARGRGLGQDVLQRAMKEMFRRWNNVSIRAVVKEDNAVSKRFFEKCNFVTIGAEVILGVPCAVYYYNSRG